MGSQLQCTKSKMERQQRHLETCHLALERWPPQRDKTIEKRHKLQKRERNPKDKALLLGTFLSPEKGPGLRSQAVRGFFGLLTAWRNRIPKSWRFRPALTTRQMIPLRWPGPELKWLASTKQLHEQLGSVPGPVHQGKSTCQHRLNPNTGLLNVHSIHRVTDSDVTRDGES